MLKCIIVFIINYYFKFFLVYSKINFYIFIFYWFVKDIENVFFVFKGMCEGKLRLISNNKLLEIFVDICWRCFL